MLLLRVSSCISLKALARAGGFHEEARRTGDDVGRRVGCVPEVQGCGRSARDALCSALRCCLTQRRRSCARWRD